MVKEIFLRRGVRDIQHKNISHSLFCRHFLLLLGYPFRPSCRPAKVIYIVVHVIGVSFLVIVLVRQSGRG